MTLRLVVTNKDPRQSDFVPAGERPIVSGVSGSNVRMYYTYTSETTLYASPRNGVQSATTITRTDHTGDRFQAGIIDWPVHRHHRAHIVVGTRSVPMTKSGIYTSPEWFTAADGGEYEWQVHDTLLQLVPRATNSYVATFVKSVSRIWLWRKQTASCLFIPPEGFEILDDIVVTFIYFASKWLDKEGHRSRVSISGPIM